MQWKRPHKKKAFSPFLCAAAQAGIELLKINQAFSAICKKQGKRGCLTMGQPLFSRIIARMGAV
jgi:hypothetical protein